MHLALCQYAIELFEDARDYRDHLESLIEQAARRGAELLVMPEYASLVMTGQMPPDVRGDLHASIEALQPMLPAWLEQCEALAKRFGIYLVPGSAPVRDDDGVYRNRAWLFGPSGLIGTQDKLIMTRFEREHWGIEGGSGLQVFDTTLGRLGILICYDNEFPMAARLLAEQGIDLIVSPSCTDTESGYYRVRTGARARALENQIAVAVSPTVGEAAWSQALDYNYGRAGLYVPADIGMPASGVVAQSEHITIDRSSWLHVELDLSAIAALRDDGQVLLRRDWPEQFDPARMYVIDTDSSTG
ncbi:carbon-nitrogen hydrolase family protein [uncultured Kushneria sp.]|uniref:carbon-nitrogen hydrolase family protein n=1 Tax=uncultured Kushneria sp. TaxID=905033 RepID=UPI002608665A|nr:carbon-nitrogen hydrolase family protein [uncultured Kushneria sp.]